MVLYPTSCCCIFFSLISFTEPTFPHVFFWARMIALEKDGRLFGVVGRLLVGRG
jgi:hypothetical protein